ncbi:YfcC family protein [Sporosarcina sp. P33]|uniref:YfcC family protein n=1 Tax=Sporosarcina sp. P33 TaxID=1930764 RepID=UPI0009C04988|nr:YfcC family protein [Sporosarcina sp. P33]ARD47091.1 C4-dicarboxylate ABC transporter [Sporosarcina sp. P33]
MEKKKFQLPTAFTTLLIITAGIAILTFLIPAGQYSYNDDGSPIVGTYEQVDANPQGLWDVFSAPINGFFNAVDIIIFVLVLGGCLGIVFETKAIDAGLSKVVFKLKGREKLMIPILMIICAIGGATYGMAEETIAFYPIVVPILLLAGYDVVTAVMVIFLGAGIGVAGGITNPFSVGIASNLAGISIGDGIFHRLLLFALFLVFGITFVMRYAAKVKKHPEKSIVYDIKSKVEEPFKKIDPDDVAELTGRRKAVLAVFGSFFLIMIVALIPWQDKFGISIFNTLHDTIQNIPVIGVALGHITPLGEWGFGELTALFFIGSIIIGKLYSYKEDEIVRLFLSGAKDLISVALILAVAKGISVVMTDGLIIGTILNFGEHLLANVSSSIVAPLAYILYIPLAFLIPSSSGLATATIPILAPLADFAGVGREYIVTAMQAGAETMNLFSPTQAVLVGALTLANIPYDRWLKHIIPFVLGIMLITIVVLTIVSII